MSRSIERVTASALPSLEKARQLLEKSRTTQECMKIKALAQAVASCAATEQSRDEAAAIVLLAKARIGELTRDAEELLTEARELLAWAWADRNDLESPGSLEWGMAKLGERPPTDDELLEPTPLRRRTRSGGTFVYFIAAHGSGKIKIGCSDDPERRLATLQSGCPVRLTIVGTIGGGFEKEKELHDRFAHLRSGGEWFGAANELVTYIRQAVTK
jgi:hypothetical protein